MSDTEILIKQNKIMSDALDQLARLGNEPHYGSSIGNEIAQHALALCKVLDNKKNMSEVIPA